MDATTLPEDFIICAMPGCGASITRDEAYYIDGCGQVCASCFGPVVDDIEPPY
jgi:hypothetical protein